MRLQKLILILFLPIVSNVYAEQNYICERPKGNSVEYLTTNKVDLPNNTFLVDTNNGNFSIKLSIDLGEKKMSFDYITNAGSAFNQSKMTIIRENQNQISFVGEFAGGVLFGSFYPMQNVLMLTQQSSWDGPDIEGAHGVFQYSQCVSSSS